MRGATYNRPAWTAALGIPLLLAATAFLQQRIDRQTPSEALERQEVLITGPLLKKLSLGYDSLLADIYWTRAVQYYGSRIGERKENFDSLAPLLNITTTLDPRLIVAYRFGAVFLSEPKPIGAGRNDLAVDLVKRGIAANPGEWRLYNDLGFLYYWRFKDYADASAAYLAGSEIPGAPVFMKLMAARVAEKGGSIETSRLIFSGLYESTKDPVVRKALLKQLRALKAEEDELHLDEKIAAFRQRFGRNPSSTRELAATGFLPGVPVDPLGFPYVIGPDGRSHLNPASPIEPPK
jgi:hypothetical protein